MLTAQYKKKQSNEVNRRGLQQKLTKLIWELLFVTKVNMKSLHIDWNRTFVYIKNVSAVRKMDKMVNENKKF